MTAPGAVYIDQSNQCGLTLARPMKDGVMYIHRRNQKSSWSVSPLIPAVASSNCEGDGGAHHTVVSAKVEVYICSLPVAKEQ